MENVYSKIKEIGPKKAEKYDALNILPFQRIRDGKHVDGLGGKINSGWFLLGNITFAKLTYKKGEMVMVNGQHQCLAVIKTGRKIRAAVEVYEVEDAFELAMLYRQFDNHRQRSIAHILKPEAAALGITWPVKIQSLVVSAAVVREFKDDHCDREDRVGFLKTYKQLGNFVSSILAPEGKLGSVSKHLARQPVVNAMMLTYQENREQAHVFWAGVRDGAGLLKSSPILRLREYLKDNNCYASKSLSKGRQTVSTEEMYEKCITAWNNFLNKKTTRLYSKRKQSTATA